MDVLSVIGEFMHSLGNWIPRPTIVRATEGGVAFWFGKWVKVVQPGWRLNWPALMALEVVPVVRQVIQLRPQTLLTADSKTIIAGAVIVYSINNVRKYLVENFDTEESIAEISGHALRDAVIGKTLAQIQETDGRRSIDRALVVEASKALANFGVNVETMRLTDFAPARVINLVGLNNPDPQRPNPPR